MISDIGVKLGVTEKALGVQFVHRFASVFLGAYTPQPFQRGTIHSKLIDVLHQRVDVAVTFPWVVMQIDMLQAYNREINNTLTEMFLL